MVDTGLCKVVKIRFPGFMPMVNPKNCASAIIKAQRQGIEEITIPGYLLHLNNFVRWVYNLVLINQLLLLLFYYSYYYCYYYLKHFWFLSYGA